MSLAELILQKVKESCKRIVTDLKKYGWIFVLILIYYFSMHAVFHAFCPVVILTGFPCPGCGMVRAILLLFAGEINRSILLNPSAAGWILLTLWSLYRRYWLGKKITGLKQTGVVLICIMIIIYGFRMAISFPGRPPMTFRYNNVLEMVIPGYTRWITSLF